MGALQTTFSVKMDLAQIQYLVVSDTQIARLKLLLDVVMPVVLRLNLYVQDQPDRILQSDFKLEQMFSLNKRSIMRWRRMDKLLVN